MGAWCIEGGMVCLEWMEREEMYWRWRTDLGVTVGVY